jgi:hypothetical protein
MKSNWMPVIFFFILVLGIFAAGCVGPDYVQKTDIVVVKLSPDGNVEWSKILDSGDTRDEASSVFEGKDGGIFIGGAGWRGRPWLIKISESGEMLWDKTFAYGYSDYVYTINQTRDDGIIIATLGGEVFLLTQKGNTVWNESVGFQDIHIIEPTPEGNFIIAGEALAKLDKYGNITGSQAFPNFTKVYPVIEMNDRKGYLVHAYSTQKNNYALRLDRNGTIRTTTPLDTLPNSTKGCTTPSGECYFMIYEDRAPPIVYFNQEYNQTMTRIGKLTPSVIFFDREGAVTGKHLLNNASPIVTGTQDGGYFSAGFGSRGQYVDFVLGSVPEGTGMAVKLNPDGTIAWEKHISNVRLSAVKSVIQTSDGGYVVAGDIEKGLDKPGLIELFFR